MTRKHDAVLKGIVETISAVEDKTFITSAQFPPPRQHDIVDAPFVVLHPVDGVDEAPRLTGPMLTQSPRWTIHSVGVTPEQAKWLGEQIKAKLVIGGLGILPTVPGERPSRFWWESPIPVQKDPDVPLFYHVAECGFRSELI